MPFDPSKPFEVVSPRKGDAPAFDPSKPFKVVGAPKAADTSQPSVAEDKKFNPLEASSMDVFLHTLKDEVGYLPTFAKEYKKRYGEQIDKSFEGALPKLPSIKDPGNEAPGLIRAHAAYSNIVPTAVNPLSSPGFASVANPLGGLSALYVAPHFAGQAYESIKNLVKSDNSFDATTNAIGAAANAAGAVGGVIAGVKGTTSLIPSIEAVTTKQTPAQANVGANEIAGVRPIPTVQSGLDTAIPGVSDAKTPIDAILSEAKAKREGEIEKLPEVYSDLVGVEKAGTISIPGIKPVRSIERATGIKAGIAKSAKESGEFISSVLSGVENAKEVEATRQARIKAGVNEYGSGLGKFGSDLGPSVVASDKSPAASDTALADALKKESASPSGKPDNPATGPLLKELDGEEVIVLDRDGKALAKGQQILADDGTRQILLGRESPGGPLRVFDIPGSKNGGESPAREVRVIPSGKALPSLPRSSLGPLASILSPKEPIGKVDTPTAVSKAPKQAPVEFGGMWELDPRKPAIELWHLTEDIPGHPKNSTLSRQTLESEGYSLPARPKQPTQQSDAIPKSSPSPLPVFKETEGGNGIQQAAPADSGPTDARPSPPAEESNAESPKEPVALAKFRGSLVDDILSRNKKAQNSPSVDVLKKKEISGLIGDALAMAGERDIAKLKGVDESAITTESLKALADKVKEIAQEGRDINRGREMIHKAEVDQLSEILKASPSAKLEEITQDRTPGERLSTLEQAKQTYGNKLKSAVDSIDQFFARNVNRDVTLDRMAGDAGYKNPLTTEVGARLDLSHNQMQNLKSEWRDPILAAVNGKELDPKSIERVNIYAIDRMNRANPDLPNTHLEDSGVKQSTIDEIRKNITPDELAYYNASRKIMDNQIFPKVSKVMRDEYGVDVSKINDYWPLQRDYSVFKKGVNHPEIVVSPGFDAAMDDLTKSMVSDFRPETTSRTNQGMTKDRIEGAGGAVRLGSNVIDSHINKAAHLVAQTHDLRVLGQIARSKWFGEKYGKRGQEYVLDLLDSIARQGDPAGSVRSPKTEFLIRNSAVGILALRFLSQTKHVTNAAIAAREIGPTSLYKGMADAFTDKGSEFIKKNFREVYERSTSEQSLAELMEGNWYAKLQSKPFIVERSIDQALARGAVLGAYLKELGKAGADTSDYLNDAVNPRAQAKAMLVARKVVTSSLRKDAPQVLSRGIGNNLTASRALYQFQATMLKNAAYAKHEIYDLGVAKGEKAKAITAAAAAAFVLASVSGITMANKPLMEHLFNYHRKPQKDGESAIGSFGKELSVEAARQIPVVGPVTSAALTRGQTGVPVVDTITQGIKSLGQYVGGKNAFGQPLSKSERQRTAADAATFISTLAGIPGASTIGQIYKDKYIPSKR